MGTLTPTVLVIADDLTGAMDVGAEFGKRGVPTLVSTDRDIDLAQAWKAYRVVAIDIESRHLTSREAAERAGRMAERACNSGATHLFKKTDSTLRGNIGSELEAIVSRTGRKPIVYVAAAPLYGRTTRRGFQFVGERLLHETAFGRDPLEPVTESFVPSILSKQTQLPIRLMSPHDLEVNRIAQIEGPGIWLIDAESEEAIASVTQRLARDGKLQLLAGTARFASHLADELCIAAAEPAPVRFGSGLLVVNGSVNETALEQLRRARGNGRFRPVELSPDLLLMRSGQTTPSENEFIDSAVAGPDEHLLLYSVLDSESVARYRDAGERVGLRGHELHLRVAQRTAELVRRIMRVRRFGLIVIFGGDTLAAITRTLHWPGFSMWGEICPGVALAEIAGTGGTFVATKPGGFGPPDVIERIEEFFRARR